MDNTGVEKKEYTDPSAPREHVHDYYGRTTMDLDHFHTFDGTTGLDYEIGLDHVHRFANVTSRAMATLTEWTATLPGKSPLFGGISTK